MAVEVEGAQELGGDVTVGLRFGGDVEHGAGDGGVEDALLERGAVDAAGAGLLPHRGHHGGHATTSAGSGRGSRRAEEAVAGR